MKKKKNIKRILNNYDIIWLQDNYRLYTNEELCGKLAIDSNKLRAAFYLLNLKR